MVAVAVTNDAAIRDSLYHKKQLFVVTTVNPLRVPTTCHTLENVMIDDQVTCQTTAHFPPLALARCSAARWLSCQLSAARQPHVSLFEHASLCFSSTSQCPDSGSDTIAAQSIQPEEAVADPPKTNLCGASQVVILYTTRERLLFSLRNLEPHSRTPVISLHRRDSPSSELCTKWRNATESTCPA